MATSAAHRSLQTLRGIISEIRRYNPNGYAKSNSLIKYIVNEYRRNQVTDRKLCRGEDELHYLARTYLCYITSHRKHQELYDEYHGKGERSIQEAANLVGLRLPKVNEHDKDK
ncbi:hypothetical protein CHUAL_000884 [Chamberlinius hualienensis]